MFREDFMMLNQDIIYFDNAATTFKPKCVVDKISDYYNNYNASVHRGDYDISYKVDNEYESVRSIIKNFVNAEDESEIIFTSGATEGLNLITKGFFENILDENDEILLTEGEHASNVLPWYAVSKNIGCNINYIKLDENYHVTIDNVLKAITPNTKVISLAHITNVIGDLRPIKEICKIAHEKDIFVVVDGAQSIPHKKIDMQNLDVDFFVASAHKICGPTGVGFLYGKYELLNNLKPLYLGGGMNESFNNINEVYYKELPHRLEAGTPNISGVIGFGEAIKYIENIGIENIELKVQNLRRYLIEELVKLPHIDIINLESDSGIVSFNVEGIFPQDVSYYLNKYNVCVRSGNHCAKILNEATKVNNTIRISLYFYNTETEIDHVVELLKDKEKILEEMF